MTLTQPNHKSTTVQTVALIEHHSGASGHTVCPYLGNKETLQLSRELKEKYLAKGTEVEQEL